MELPTEVEGRIGTYGLVIGGNLASLDLRFYSTVKKQVLLPLLFAGFGAAHSAQAQGALVDVIRAGIHVGTAIATSAKRPVAVPAAPTAPTVISAAQVAASFQQLKRQRTPAGQLPPRGAEAIAALEAQLERCHETYLVDSTGVICSPAQRTALQQASIRIVQANSNWDLQPYQREASFYIGEDSRRQLVRTGVRVVVPPSARPAPARAALLPAPLAPVATAAEVATRFRQVQLQRTPAAQLPRRGPEAITVLETELERCHQAYLSDSTGVICSPAQRTALQQAAARLVQANSGWNSMPYQREAAFYIDEDARRHQVSIGAPVGTPAPRPIPSQTPASSLATIPVWVPAAFRQLQLHRTAVENMPLHGAEQVKALEAELERCHAALLADSTQAVCPPAQRTALQQAAVAVAKASPGWGLDAYQREAAFYIGEDMHRQKAAAFRKN